MKYKNNPLNIRFNASNHWRGLIGKKNGFCEFESLENGFRAAAIILRRYRSYGKVSLVDIIHRWAPENDNNNTDSYIKFVSDSTGIPMLRPVEENEYFEVLLSMARVEQGCYDSRWERPLSLALESLKIDINKNETIF